MLSEAALRRLRQRAQSLAEPRPADPHEVVRRLGAVQAQVPLASRLAIRARSSGLTARSVTDATNGERSLVRAWVQRGTIHMVRPRTWGGWSGFSDRSSSPPGVAGGRSFG